jgi:streptomycin 6-kinase
VKRRFARRNGRLCCVCIDVSITIPRPLVESCGSVPERVTWLDRLPLLVSQLMRRWSLSIGEPFEASCAWVAPAVRQDGRQAVIKINMPHFEAEREIAGLRFWAGVPTVRLLEADDELDAMLLERCAPGTSLRSVPEPEQDRIIADLLRRLWRVPPDPSDFRPLSLMVARWCEETRAEAGRWPDPGLVEDGLRVFEELAATDDHPFLLATDLHAGNVLRAEREPWLVVDPKPFIGDPAYDATQHLLNCKARVHADPRTTVTRFAELLDVDAERVRLWLFARVAAGPGVVWDTDAVALARLLRG